jgi:hypothetical protein
VAWGLFRYLWRHHDTAKRFRGLRRPETAFWFACLCNQRLLCGYPGPRRVTLDEERNVPDRNCRSLLSLLRWRRACAWFPAGAGPRTWPPPCGAAELATIPLGFALAFVWGAAGADIFHYFKQAFFPQGRVDGMAGRPCLQRAGHTGRTAPRARTGPPPPSTPRGCIWCMMRIMPSSVRAVWVGSGVDCGGGGGGR